VQGINYIMGGLIDGNFSRLGCRLDHVQGDMPGITMVIIGFPTSTT
jgi:hypothetical protein